MYDAAEKKTIGTVSFETRMLADRLLQATPDTPFITYTMLSALIGKNVQDDGRHNLDAARAIVFREKQMLFGIVWDEGIKLLTDVERVATGEGVKDRVRRLTRRGIRNVMSVQNFDALPQDQKVKHHLYVSLFRITDASTRPKKIMEIEGSVRDVMRALNAKEVLRLFEGKKEK